MSYFTCELCEKEFTTKQNLQYHTNKNVCRKKKDNICCYCNKVLSCKSSVYRHKKKCKPNICEDSSITKSDMTLTTSLIDVDKLYHMFVQLKEENNDLKKKMNNIENSSNTNNITNNTNYVNNGIVNNSVNQYILVGYGKEDMDKIDRSDLLKVLRSGFNSPLTLTETMHFNPKYPEFHNVYIPSMKDKYAMIYDGTNWTMVTKEYLIDKMYDDKRDYIEENLDEFLDSITESQRKALQRWMNAKEVHPYIQKIKEDIKLLLYNKRRIPLDSKRKSEGLEDNIMIDIERAYDTILNIPEYKECNNTNEEDCIISEIMSENIDKVVIEDKQRSRYLVNNKNLSTRSFNAPRNGAKRKVMTR